MAKIIHTVTMPDGTTAKRVSENHEYPFVLIGQPSKEWDAQQAQYTGNDARHWKYLVNCANTQPGRCYPGERFTVDQADHDKGAATVAQYTDAAAYSAAQVAARLAKIEESEAKGYYRRWDALAWSSRRDLAEKVKAKFPHRVNLQILETARTAK